MINVVGSQYVEEARRDYSLYVLQHRAIPHATDGLKAAARRVLWVARDGKKIKSATLAGATMPIHPHTAPEGTINTLAAPYGNNIPLLVGIGAFGTKLNPSAFGASRYTAVKVAEFTKDVIFRDIEIIPMQDNYDGTLQEPTHFLPLVPIALLNPQQGMAIGFASNILPRNLIDVIKAQIQYLKYPNKPIQQLLPTFTPSSQTAVDFTFDDGGKMKRFTFHGTVQIGTRTVTVLDLPYGLSHEDFIKKLIQLEEKSIILGYVDDSRDEYKISVRFRADDLTGKQPQDVLETLGLINSITENLTLIDFNGERVWSPSTSEVIQHFCDWRLKWYYKRYENLAAKLAVDIEKLRDILLAIKHNVGGIAKKIKDRAELKEFLTSISITHINFIADLPVYRFTEDERHKVEVKLAEHENTMHKYEQYLASEDARREIYVAELEEILTKSRKGTYQEALK